MNLHRPSLDVHSIAAALGGDVAIEAVLRMIMVVIGISPLKALGSRRRPVC